MAVVQDEWFDPDKSPSAIKLGCKDPKCNCGTPSCQCNDNRCYYSRTYGKEGHCHAMPSLHAASWPACPACRRQHTIHPSIHISIHVKRAVHLPAQNSMLPPPSSGHCQARRFAATASCTCMQRNRVNLPPFPSPPPRAAERSSSEGWLIEDNFQFPDNHTAVRLVFGCENGETGEIYKQMADGIMGMGNNNNAFQSQVRVWCGGKGRKGGWCVWLGQHQQAHANVTASG